MTIPINYFGVSNSNGLFAIGSGVSNGTGTNGQFLPAVSNQLLAGDGQSGQAVVFEGSSPNAFVANCSNDTLVQFGAARALGWTSGDTSGWGQDLLQLKHAIVTKFNSGSDMPIWAHANWDSQDTKIYGTVSSSYYLAGDADLGGWINYSANGGTLTYNSATNRLVCSSSTTAGSRAGLQSPLPFDTAGNYSKQLLYIKNFKALESPEVGPGSGCSFFISFYDNGDTLSSEVAALGGNTNSPVGRFLLIVPSPYTAQGLVLQMPDYRDEQDLWIYFNNIANEISIYSNYEGVPRAVYQGPLQQAGTVIPVSLNIYAGRTVNRSHGIQFEALYHTYLL